MQSLFTSIVRTLVPFLVGYVVSLLVTQGVDVSENFEDQLSGFLTFAFGAIYYVAVRLLARKFPKLEWLLGIPTKPSYPSK